MNGKIQDEMGMMWKRVEREKRGKIAWGNGDRCAASHPHRGQMAPASRPRPGGSAPPAHPRPGGMERVTRLYLEVLSQASRPRAVINAKNSRAKFHRAPRATGSTPEQHRIILSYSSPCCYRSPQKKKNSSSSSVVLSIGKIGRYT